MPKTIPDDNAAGVSSSVFVAERGRIKDLNVTLPSPGIVTSVVGDLAIDITGPDGTTVRLADHPARPRQRRPQHLRDDVRRRGGQEHLGGPAPFTGNFRPQNDQLSRFDGKSRRGTVDAAGARPVRGRHRHAAAWGVATQKARCDVDTTAPGTVIGAVPATRPPRDRRSSRSARPTPARSSSAGSTSALARRAGKTVAYSRLRARGPQLRARAIDGSDNEDPTPATYNWKVTEPAAGFVLAPVEERLVDRGVGALPGAGGVRLGVPGEREADACRGAPRGKLDLGRSAVTIGSGTSRRQSAGTAKVALRLTKRARVALRGREPGGREADGHAHPGQREAHRQADRSRCAAGAGLAPHREPRVQAVGGGDPQLAR